MDAILFDNITLKQILLLIINTNLGYDKKYNYEEKIRNIIEK